MRLNRDVSYQSREVTEKNSHKTLEEIVTILEHPTFLRDVREKKARYISIKYLADRTAKTHELVKNALALVAGLEITPDDRIAIDDIEKIKSRRVVVQKPPSKKPERREVSANHKKAVLHVLQMKGGEMTQRDILNSWGEGLSNNILLKDTLFELIKARKVRKELKQEYTIIAKARANREMTYYSLVPKKPEASEN